LKLIYFHFSEKSKSFSKKKSLKDEISFIKNIITTEEDELSPETIAETMKNTLYNKIVGKIEDD